jgi:transketolase
MTSVRWEQAYQSLDPQFGHWEKTKDITDQFIDLMLNYRQSGHPGGSRSKVHALLALMLSGEFRYDLRRPDRPFCDRFVLIAGHTCPVVYAVLATLHEALRIAHQDTGNARYAVKHGAKWALTWEDLLRLRRRGGLPGHAEFEGKTLLFRANTGPTGHGFPPAVGIAMALKRAGAESSRVFAIEGEGGTTAGAAHESMNSAWGLGLDNLYVLLDWNDFGIDHRAASSVVYGTPADWFGSHGWRTFGADNGSAWPEVTRALLQATHDPAKSGRPACIWFKTRKGRGYGKFDHHSHGTPHKLNTPEFWETKREFQTKYGVQFAGFGEAAPSDPAALRDQAQFNLRLVADVMKQDVVYARWLADRLVEIGESVPIEPVKGFRIERSRTPWSDPKVLDPHQYPASIWLAPGEKAPNRQSLASWGSYLNSYAKQHYGRPMFLAMSADLAESTNVHGFGKGWSELENYGWYEREQNPEGVILPQEITEFANSGISAGIGSVNFSDTPEENWDGFGAAHSTYGSFSYLKYGPMRLYSQLAQDCDFKVGPVIWIAGHSGPETAEDSRTHFGIYEPGVTQLFPEGHVCDLHPWEANEVPVLLGSALAGGFNILALHLTRPAVEIPDRAKLGMASHFEAAKGAYLIRDYAPGKPRGGVVVVQGTSSTANLVKALPELEKLQLNVKIVAAVSPQLFERQTAAYRDAVLSNADRLDVMGVTNRSRNSMRRWLGSDTALEYTLCADWDNRWRTGGSVDEVVDESHLSTAHIIAGISRFVSERRARLDRMTAAISSLQ